LTNFAIDFSLRVSRTEAPVPTMNVSLPTELAEFVEREVAAGEYGTASEVVRDGLRLLRRDREARAEKLAVLRREVGIGVDQARAGRLSTRSAADIAAALREAEARSV
jgi:antitoxin ParD1/3/4